MTATGKPLTANHPDYARIARAIIFIAEHFAERPSLERIAAHSGLSKYHFHRLFVRWSGLSPKQYLAHLTLTRARYLLRANASVLDAALESGLSGPGRLHDLFVRYQSMTPGQYKNEGAGLTMRHAVHQTIFGPVLIVSCEQGITAITFIDSDGAHALSAVRAHWPRSRFVPDPMAGSQIAQALMPQAGECPPMPFNVLVKGTFFQMQVWRALIDLPRGSVTSYGALAKTLGAAKAARAVGTAIGANPIALVIPCHRVLRGDGGLAQYAWGTARKRAILALEAAHTPPPKAVSPP